MAHIDPPIQPEVQEQLMTALDPLGSALDQQAQIEAQDQPTALQVGVDYQSSKFWLQLFVSLLIGALLCVWTFRNESIQWRDFQGISWLGFGLYWLVFAFAHWVRIARWGLFIKALTPVSWLDLLKIGGIGYLCISILPFRIGEAIRPYLLQKQSILSASSSAATVVVERVIDGILFVGLFFIFMWKLPPTQHSAVSMVKISALMAGAFFTAILLVLLLAYFQRQKTVNMVKKLSAIFSQKLSDKGTALLESFLDGLAILPRKDTLLAFLLLTFVYWVVQGFSMVYLAQAVGIYDLDTVESFALLAILVVGIMLPAGPGYTGSFELALKGGFALVTVAQIDKIPLFIIALHLAQLSVQVVFGMLAFLIPYQGKK